MKIRPVLTIKTAQITQKWKAKLYEIMKKARFWGVLVTMATFQAYRHPKEGGAFFTQITVGRGHMLLQIHQSEVLVINNDKTSPNETY